MPSLFLRVFIIVCSSLAPICALAQYTSTGPIKLIVAQAAGGGNDTAARILAEELSPAIGRPIVVENRPGALGTLAAGAVARATPDGHTLLMVGGTAITGAPHLMSSLSYDPQNDLVPVYQLAGSRMLLLVGVDSPARNVAELVHLTSRHPGKYSYAAHHASNIAAMEAFMREMKIELFYVPYKGGPQALIDVAGGVVTAMFNDVSGSESLIDAGRLRPLAIMSRERSTRFPDVPTVFEGGFQGPVVDIWTGVFAPAGTPLALVSYLNLEIAKVAANPAVRVRMDKLGLVLNGQSTPTSFSAFIREETEMLGPLLKLRQAPVIRE